VFVAHKNGVSELSKSAPQSKPHYLLLPYVQQLETLGGQPVVRTSKGLTLLQVDDSGRLVVKQQMSLPAGTAISVQDGQLLYGSSLGSTQ